MARFEVEIIRSRRVVESVTVTVEADNERAACDHVAALADPPNEDWELDQDDIYNWETSARRIEPVEDSDEEGEE